MARLWGKCTEPCEYCNWLHRQRGLWHNGCPAAVLVDLWLAAGWQHVFSRQHQVWTLRTPCSWNSTWWWPITRNKSLQKSVSKRVNWSTSLRRARAVSNQNKRRHVLLCVCQALTDSSSNIVCESQTSPSPLFYKLWLLLLIPIWRLYLARS